MKPQINYLLKWCLAFCTISVMGAGVAAAEQKTTMSNGAAKAKPDSSSPASGAAEKVLGHHLGAFAKGVDELMKDYTERSVIITPDKTYRGHEEIKGFFAAFIKNAEPGFWKAFKIRSQSVEGDTAYLVWESKPFVAMATDTLVVRNNKIAVQTFTPFAN